MPRRFHPPLVPEPECLQCGYDLRGLSADGQCPECALAVRVSLTHDRLEGRELVFVAERVRVLFWVGIGRSVAILTAFFFDLSDGPPVASVIFYGVFFLLTLLRVWVARSLSRGMIAIARVTSHRQAAQTMRTSESARGILILLGLALFGVLALLNASTMSASPIVALLATSILILDPLCFAGWHKLGSTVAARLGDHRLARNTSIASVVGAALAATLAVFFCVGPIIAMVIHHVLVFRLMRSLDAATKHKADLGSFKEGSS